MPNSFLTGCDENTEWQLPWFITNLRQHSDTPLIISDFGMSSDMVESLEPLENITVTSCKSQAKGWFKKPRAPVRR